MPDYQRMYTTLFNAVTDAPAQLAQQNVGTARELLIAARQQTEALYMSSEDG